MIEKTLAVYQELEKVKTDGLMPTVEAVRSKLDPAKLALARQFV